MPVKPEVFKAKMPLKQGEKYSYPLTSYDQIILENGERWNGQQSGTVTSINGITPDESGNVVLEGEANFTTVNAETITANKIIGAVYM